MDNSTSKLAEPGPNSNISYIITRKKSPTGPIRRPLWRSSVWGSKLYSYRRYCARRGTSEPQWPIQLRSTRFHNLSQPSTRFHNVPQGPTPVGDTPPWARLGPSKTYIFIENTTKIKILTLRTPKNIHFCKFSVFSGGLGRPRTGKHPKSDSNPSKFDFN